ERRAGPIAAAFGQAAVPAGAGRRRGALRSGHGSMHGFAEGAVHGIAHGSGSVHGSVHGPTREPAHGPLPLSVPGSTSIRRRDRGIPPARRPAATLPPGGR